MKVMTSKTKDKLFIVLYDKQKLSYTVQDFDSDLVYEKGFNIPRTEVKQPGRLLNRLKEQYDNANHSN